MSPPSCAIAIRSIRKDGVALFISQSGETADTLAALRDAKEQGQTTLAIVNVAESSIAREADIVLPTFAGPGDRRRLDQGVHLPACRAGLARHRRGRARGTHRRPNDEARLCAACWKRRATSSNPETGSEDRSSGEEIAKARDVLYLGRGVLIRWRWKARSS